MKLRLFALTGLSSLALLASASVAAAAPVKIELPGDVESPRTAPYSVSVAAAATRVDFYLDGERRWTAHPRARHFDRSGELATATLATGSHSIRVAARIGRRVRIERRSFEVTSPRRSPAISPSTPIRPSSGGSSTPPEATGSTKPPVEVPKSTPTAPSEAVTGRLLFGNKFDGSFSGWYLQSIKGRATISTTAPFAGTGSGRFEVRQGDVEPDTGSNRSEVSGPTYNAGEDLYFRDVIRVPAADSFNGSWQIINQLHETDWGGSPGIATFLNSDHTLQFGAGDGSPTYWKSPKLNTDQWYTMIYRVKLSQDASQGFVEVWLNGVPQKPLNGSTRMFGQTIQTARTYLKVGIYRTASSTGTSLVEHDNVAVGTSYSVVASY